MNHDAYEEDYIRTILNEVKVIAMAGASARQVRPSFFVLKYLLEKGYDVIPVNPGLAGGDILGQRVYASLDEIPEKVDMVDIFRNSRAAGPLTAQAIEMGASVVWMQLGVRNDEAAIRAEAAGLKVVMDRCPKMEYGKLCGEWGWLGARSSRISARRPALSGKRVQSLSIRPTKR